MFYGLIRKENKIKVDLPKNYDASQHTARFPYLDNAKDPKFLNESIDIVKNKADLRKYLLATSDYGRNIQENINSVVRNGKFNNVALRHLLDEKNKGIFNSPALLSIIFRDVKKFDVQNPVIANLLSHVNAS